MKNPGQFGSNKSPAEKTGPGTLDCAAFEQLLAEFAESGLPEATMEHLRTHAAGCAGCQEKLAQARRGREWLLVLKQEPLAPPVDMVARILAHTSMAGMAGAPGTGTRIAPVLDHGTASSTRSGFADANNPRAKDVFSEYDEALPVPAYAAGKNLQSTPADFHPGRGAGSLSSAPAWQRNTVVVLRRTLVEPRLAMVAAMAFFSITLTLNLMGIRLTNMHPADLAPRNMRRAASRQYAEVNARVARYYENLRIVYEVEARVQQLRRAAETSPPEQGTRPRKRSSNSNGGANDGQNESHREGMVKKRAAGLPQLRDPEPVITGPRMDAALHLPDKMQRVFAPLRMTALFGTAGPSSALRSPAHKNCVLGTWVSSGRNGKFIRVQVLGYPQFRTANKLDRFSRRSFSAPERGFA